MWDVKQLAMFQIKKTSACKVLKMYNNHNYYPIMQTHVTLPILRETLHIDDVNTQLLNVHIIQFKGVITIIVIN